MIARELHRHRGREGVAPLHEEVAIVRIRVALDVVEDDEPAAGDVLVQPGLRCPSSASRPARQVCDGILEELGVVEAQHHAAEICPLSTNGRIVEISFMMRMKCDSVRG